MCRRSEEEHLPRHHPGDRAQLGHPEGCQALRGRRAVGQTGLEDLDDIAVTGHHPAVQIAIPVHGILGTQPVVKGVGIGQDLRVEQVVQARGAGGRAHRSDAPGGESDDLVVAEGIDIGDHELGDPAPQTGHRRMVEQVTEP
jgi:hypothetical protein